MSYLILILSLLMSLLLIISKNIFFKHHEQINIKITKGLSILLKFIMIVPIIVLMIIIILSVSYFKTKLNIRLSHAWLVVSFWICDVIFYYIYMSILKIKKSIIILPAIGMLICTYAAVILTPLNHYENIFKNISLTLPNLAALIMLIAAYYADYKLINDKKWYYL